MTGSTPGLHGLRIENIGEKTSDPEAIRIGSAAKSIDLHFIPTVPIGPGDVAVAVRFPPEGIIDVVLRFHFVDGAESYVEIPRTGRNRYAGVVRLPKRLKSVTLETGGSGDPRAFREISLKPVNGLVRLHALLRRIVRVGSREIRRLSSRLGPGQGRRGAIQRQADYRTWMERFDERPDIDQDLHRDRALRLGDGALLSFVVDASSDDRQLDATIGSLCEQFYPHWELIILAPTSAHWRLSEKIEAERRIAVRSMNECLASAFNDALSLAKGSFIAAIPLGARLPAHALTEIASAIEAHPQVELLYTDEDRLNGGGRRHAPRFKPKWSPDYLRSRDYVGDLTIYRTETMRRIGGWRDHDGIEDYDAKLRLTDEVSATRGAILHLPKVLVHIPDRPEVSRPAAEHARRGEGETTWKVTSGHVHSLLQAPEAQPTVSIIIPTRDQAAILADCVRSILDRTDYGTYEIIIVDNASQEPETARVFEALSRDRRVRIIEYPHPFNYSAINNHAVRHSRGAVLALLNNDVEVIEPTWLSDMTAHASRTEIGCVGAKLLYPDGTVQHGGILLGVAGLAGHAHRYAPGTADGYLGRLQSVLNVSAVTAACLAVRREVFDEVGGLDEVGLATAFNDVDFCLKVQAAGYRNLWSPNAVLIHHESKSRGYERTPAKRARLAQEEDVMRRRWGRMLLEDPYYSPCLTRLSEDFRPRRT